MYALIMAGGVGTRLWPRSRQRSPKQLLDLASEFTMLQETFSRLTPLMPPANVYVVTGAAYASEVARQLPEVPQSNIIAEPFGRNTAPAIGLGSLYIRRREAQAVMAAVSADHLVQKKQEFVQVMRSAAVLAEQGYLVTIGIRPARPETGYGYIELDHPLGIPVEYPGFRVARFTEKPDAATAERFVAGGKHLWNAGMFVWRVDVILDAIRQHLPGLSQALEEIDRAIGTPKERDTLERVWPSIDEISIDVGVMERAGNVAVIPADLGWSDVGTWASLAEILPADEANNVVINGEHIGVGTSGSLLYGNKRLIATIGLKDLIVVDTDDVVLICPKDRAQDVRSLVAKLKQDQRHEYL